jgi:hypothetical protein
MQWKVQAARPRWLPTLAYVAATQHDPGFAKQRRVLAVLNAHNNPLATFSSAAEVPRLSVSEVICDRATTEDTGKCEQRRASLRGRIVVVGDEGDADRHESAMGYVHGVYLQASYIEALLDDRYFIPLPRSLYFLMLILAAGGIQLAFWRTEKPGKVMILCIAALAAATIVSYLVVLQLGYVLTPWVAVAGLTLFAVLRFLDSQAHLLGHPAE